MERIGAALDETVAALGEAGFAVVYGGDDASAALADRAVATGHEVIRYGIAGSAQHLDVVAENVQITGSGSRFTWRWPGSGLSHDITLPLLGRHQVLNVSAALATVHRLGLPLQPALTALPSLQPVEHRLQPVPTGNAITVIDDSYNANPESMQAAIEVLAAYPGRTILVMGEMCERGDSAAAMQAAGGELAERAGVQAVVALGGRSG